MRSSSAVVIASLLVAAAAVPGTSAECLHTTGDTVFWCSGDDVAPATLDDIATEPLLEFFFGDNIKTPLAFAFPTLNPEGYFGNLEKMNVVNSNVTWFEPVDGSLPNLVYLTLSKGSVNTNLTAIAKLTSLLSLELSSFVGLKNTTIPDVVSSLTGLTSLSLEGLGLTGPLPALNDLTELKVLKLAGNKLVGGCIPDDYTGTIDIPFDTCTAPTPQPSVPPTKLPTNQPSQSPTKSPTVTPTKSPSVLPSTEAPSGMPITDLQAGQLPLLIGSAAGAICLVMFVAFFLWKLHKKTNKQTSGSLMSQPSVDRETGRNIEKEKKRKEKAEEQRIVVAKDDDNTVFDPIKGWVAGANPGGKKHAARPPPKK